MALKIFGIKDKATNKTTRLVKAETKAQVNRHLINSVEIEPMSAIDLADLMATGEVLHIETAALQATTEDEVTNPPPAVTTAGAMDGANAESQTPATDVPDGVNSELQTPAADATHTQAPSSPD